VGSKLIPSTILDENGVKPMPGLIPAPNKTKTKIFKFSKLQKIALDHHLKSTYFDIQRNFFWYFLVYRTSKQFWRKFSNFWFEI
jgi:hypothetical protein